MSSLGSKLKRLLWVLFLLSISTVTCLGQSGRPDEMQKRPDPPPPKIEQPPPSKPIKRPKPPPPKPDPVGHITLQVRPSDSRVIFNNQQVMAVDSTGILTFRNLKLNSHVLVVRRDGYRDRSLSVKPVAGENKLIEVVLEPLPGILHVAPSIGGAQITVRSLDVNREPITRFGVIESLEIPAGDYEITVSKDEYVMVTRRVTIRRAESFRFEPQLLAVEIPKPQSPARKVITIPMASAIEVSGKYLIVRIRGASGELTNSGAIDVMANKLTSSLPEIKGSLPGLPCEIEFVRIANVAEASLLETPGPSNQWSTVAIRVRPKDQKRLIHFAINWRSLERAQAAR